MATWVNTALVTFSTLSEAGWRCQASMRIAAICDIAELPSHGDDGEDDNRNVVYI
jgi:hypothetical protein